MMKWLARPVFNHIDVFAVIVMMILLFNDEILTGMIVFMMSLLVSMHYQFKDSTRHE